MTIRHYATIGTVSAGTLRDEDLLDAFASELEYHVRCNKRCRGLGLPAKRKLIKEAYAAAGCADARADDLIQELQDALQDFAPPYTYFGALEGDGADFGFWPDPGVGVDDDLLPRFADEAPAGFRGDCVLINERGNMSVGYVNGRHELKPIWGCV